MNQVDQTKCYDCSANLEEAAREVTAAGQASTSALERAVRVVPPAASEQSEGLRCGLVAGLVVGAVNLPWLLPLMAWYRLGEGLPTLVVLFGWHLLVGALLGVLMARHGLLRSGAAPELGSRVVKVALPWAGPWAASSRGRSCS